MPNIPEPCESFGARCIDRCHQVDHDGNGRPGQSVRTTGRVLVYIVPTEIMIRKASFVYTFCPGRRQ